MLRPLLTVFGVIGLLLLVLNLFAIIYIVTNYIYKLKIKSKFVILFYSLALILTFLMMGQFAWNIFRKDYPSIDVDGPNYLTPNNVLESLIKVASTALGFSIVATMYKIGVSMQCVLGEITVEQKRRRKVCFYWFCITCTVLLVPELFLIYID